MTAASFDALLAEHTPARQRTSVFSWAQALWSMALAVGALCAAAPDLIRSAQPDLGELEAYGPPFVLIIGLTIAATLLLLPMRPSLGDLSTIAGTRQDHGWLPRRSLGVIARYSLALGMFGFGLGIAVQLLPLWFNLRFGVDEAALGPWYAAAQILSLGSVVLAPWLDRRFGTAVGVVMVQLLGSACLFWIALVAPTFELAALAVVARTILANLAWPLQQATLMARAAPEERASAAGHRLFSLGSGECIGPVLGGAMMQGGALALPVVLGAIAYGLGGVAFLVGFGQRSGGQLRLDSHGPGADGQDGHRDGRQSRDRQSDRARAGRRRSRRGDRGALGGLARQTAAELAEATGRRIVPIVADTSSDASVQGHGRAGRGGAGPHRHPGQLRGAARWAGARRPSSPRSPTRRSMATSTSR